MDARIVTSVARPSPEAPPEAGAAWSRRRFCGLAASAVASVTAAAASPPQVPAHLRRHEQLYAKDPRAASVEWFRTARLGLQVHYGLYSLLGRGEWVQYMEKIPLAEYGKLKDRFTARRFDADFITDLARDAEATYVNFVTRHHDSFALWDTRQSDWNSVRSPAHRDFVAEMAEQCR